MKQTSHSRNYLKKKESARGKILNIRGEIIVSFDNVFDVDRHVGLDPDVRIIDVDD